MTERASLHLQQVNRINAALTDRRNSFVAQYQNGRMGSRLLTYEPKLDREVYKTLKTFQDGSTAYDHAKNNLNGYTSSQVETFIGERLHVGLSSFRYDIRDGQLYGQGINESLLEMIKRGRECRDALAQDVDKPRQDAELVQFAKIQREFTQEDEKGNLPPVGKTIISISPPGGEGSAYAHNFYDVFVLSEDKETKERYVAAHRYASELSLDEYKALAESLSPGYFAEHKNEPLDSYFLSRPLVLDTKSQLSASPEKIHATLHKGHEFLSSEDFGIVKRHIAGLVVSYVNTLLETPDDEQFLNLTLNAIMNKADHVASRLRRAGHFPQSITLSNQHPTGIRGEIFIFGNQKVRQVSTGCGASSGFNTGNRTPSNLSPFDSVDFGKDNFGSRSFHCPECGELNIRPLNQLIPNCQHCGSEKVAC